MKNVWPTRIAMLVVAAYLGVYWYSNPELTYMQVFLDNWRIYVIAVAFALVAEAVVFSVNRRYK
jgi:hypothetical protein